MLHDGGRSIDQRALKGSPKIEFFLITQVIWKQFLSVIHNHMVDFMEGNRILRTSLKVIALQVYG